MAAGPPGNGGARAVRPELVRWGDWWVLGPEISAMSPNPMEIIGVEVIDVTKPHERIRFGASDVTKPYEGIGFGAIRVTKPYQCIGFEAPQESQHVVLELEFISRRGLQH